MEILMPSSPPLINGNRSIISVKKVIRSNHGGNCTCCCCNVETKLFRYVQPEVPKSFAPIRNYERSCEQVDKNTTYKMSYWENAPAPLRAKPFIPQGSLTAADGVITDDTTHRLSFLGNWGIGKAQSARIKPCTNRWLGRGPMQEATTNNCAYIWKCGSRRKAKKRKGNLYCPNVEFADDTTYKLSYYGASNVIPIKSFKPIRKYEKIDVPMDDWSTYKLSYWPNEAHAKENPPWSKKLQYQCPQIPLETHTTYGLSYWPNRQPTRSPLKVKNTENLLGAGNYNDKCTTYYLSYFGSIGDRRQPIRPSRINQWSPTGPLSENTTNRLSYFGNWGIAPPAPIRPCTKKISGRGPIDDMTTHKQDFTRKCGEPRMPLRPKNHFVPSKQPLDNCTTQRLSYFENDPRVLIKSKSFKPIRVYEPVDVPFEAETTMKLSYQPVEPRLCPVKVSSGKEYYRPLLPFADNTTYNLSYICPGKMEPVISPC